MPDVPVAPQLQGLLGPLQQMVVSYVDEEVRSGRLLRPEAVSQLQAEVDQEREELLDGMERLTSSFAQAITLVRQYGSRGTGARRPDLLATEYEPSDQAVASVAAALAGAGVHGVTSDMLRSALRSAVRADLAEVAQGLTPPDAPYVDDR